MQPVLLRDLEATGVAVDRNDHVEFQIEPAWCVAGEDRVGFAGIVRLIECVREWHWRRDVAAVSADVTLDSITKALEVEFISPVRPGRVVRGECAVVAAGEKSYTVEVKLCEEPSGDLLAVGRLVSVFYDDGAGASVTPPERVAARLRSLLQ